MNPLLLEDDPDHDEDYGLGWCQSCRKETPHIAVPSNSGPRTIL